MSKISTGQARWEHAAPNARARKHRSVACVELITTAALALSTAVAVTAVSIGIARADVVGSVGSSNGAPIAIALFLSLLLSGMGALTAITANDHTRRD